MYSLIEACETEIKAGLSSVLLNKKNKQSFPLQIAIFMQLFGAAHCIIDIMFVLFV